MNISAQHYDWVRDYMKRRAALVLEADKKYLVYNRLLPVALKANLKTVDDLISRVMSPSGARGPEAVAGVIAMLASEDGIHITGEDIRVDGGTLS